MKVKGGTKTERAGRIWMIIKWHFNLNFIMSPELILVFMLAVNHAQSKIRNWATPKFEVVIFNWSSTDRPTPNRAMWEI
jgi:type IV secretory pathway VirB3-like protein